MDRNKALATGVALVLTITGGVSALFMTLGAAEPATPVAATEIVEYVDAAGNPVPAAQAGVATPAPPAAAPTAAAAPSAGAHEDDEEHEREAYEDEEGEDDHEDEDEHGDHEDEEEEHDG